MSRRLTVGDDRGASVVEFVMISTLLVFLLFGALQVAVFLYARTVVAAAATQGARYGASQGIGARQGAERAGAVIATDLPRAAQVPCSGRDDVDAVTGLPTTTVHCRGRLRLVLVPLRVPVWIDVQSSVVTEVTP